MAKKGYDLTKLDKACNRIISSGARPSDSAVANLKKVLNEFFTEAKCEEVYYTLNTDKMFFGACVLPVLSNEETLNIILTDKDMKITNYYLEIDSKLVDMGLTDKELTAIILHEIGHVVTSGIPIKQVRANIDKYFADKDKILQLQKSVEYTNLLTFAIKDVVYKLNSFRFRKNEEVIADSFVVMCGYGEPLKSALTKISNNAWTSGGATNQPRLVIMDWVFKVYTQLKYTRIPAIKTLEKSKALTGSVLTKKEVTKVINSLQKIDTDVVQECNNQLLQEARKKSGFIHSIKMNGLRGIEEDLFEYRVRIKAVQTEDEALYILHQINSRLTILEDYLDNNEDLPKSDVEKYLDLIRQYRALREQVANSKIFKQKNYGLWYDYNQLDSDDKMY